MNETSWLCVLIFFVCILFIHLLLHGFISDLDYIFLNSNDF